MLMAQSRQDVSEGAEPAAAPQPPAAAAGQQRSSAEAARRVPRLPDPETVIEDPALSAPQLHLAFSLALR